MDEEQQKREQLNKQSEEETSVVRPQNIPDNRAEAIRNCEQCKVRRVVVDRDACIGAQSCVVVANGLFKMDEENLAYIDDPNAYDEDTLLLAAQACPVLAIHLYDKDGKKIFPEE
ncbi:MAG: ferredoxin [Candidatus Magasanikbacteria bacterium]